jgi:xanthine dehydrogenase small subunit
MEVKTLKFWHRGQLREMQNVPPTRTLLQLLREDLHMTGTKEGCNEGDCGACTVVLREPGVSGYKAVNSCIRLAHSIEGMELTAVEDLSADNAGSAQGHLHPCQQAMLECHGSQCGFCTPGFVMSLYALHENSNGQPVSRAQAQEALSGNLCRCTGYRPILDAAVRMQKIDLLLQKREQTNKEISRPSPQKASKNPVYMLPERLQELLALRAQYPQAQLVAGCTDVGLWINKGHQQFAQILDVTRVEELRRVERYSHHIAIGAAVTLQDAYAALAQDRPHLKTFASRFAGLTVRNSGTLGGNVANGSPIGDSMPLLIALRANVVLMSVRGHREMPLEKLYTGYRQNVIAKDEVLAWIKVPLPTANEFSRVYKISKRYDDDISAVCLALSVQRDGDALRDLSIGIGGVAATPVRAIKTEANYIDFITTDKAFSSLKVSLQAEFQPISDMRASSSYRREMLAALVQRFALELQGETLVSLESWDALEEVLA